MKIKNYLEFFESNSNKIRVPLQFSNRFCNILKNIDSPISKALIDQRLSDEDFSLVDIGKYSDTASYTTSQKLIEHFKVQYDWRPDLSPHVSTSMILPILNILIKPLNREEAPIYHKNRTEIKIGRLVKKILLDTFPDSEIEKFVNQYKSILSKEELKFEFLEGSDLRVGYQSQNYTYTGSSSNPLINSCMNDCLDFIDFYLGCPVKLLVLLNSENHIFGRALVWEIEKGVFFMDRVYAAFESDYFKFIEHAKSNGWWWKSENKSGSRISFTNGKTTEWFPVEISLNFDFYKYQNYGYEKKVPYLDTFIYCQNNKLTNYIPKSGTYYKLVQADGTFDIETQDND
jgi:hypothetical protein